MRWSPSICCWAPRRNERAWPYSTPRDVSGVADPDTVRRMGQLNLIRLFDFYLGAMFLLGTLRRLEQYHSVGRILVAAPGRWPNLMRVMRQHRAVFFTWSTVRPALLALALSVLHMVATRLIWPTANVTIHQLIERWYLLPVLLMALLPMLGLDVFFLVRVSRIDRAETDHDDDDDADG